jgi:two-component system chemotaxis response regulator CheY
MHKSVLLIDDEPALRIVVGDRLRHEGYSVEYAGNGDEGLAKATGARFE